MDTITPSYYELRKRAASRGINTFGDLARRAGVDPRDLFGDSEWDPAMKNEPLYNCDAAYGTLELFALEGLI